MFWQHLTIWVYYLLGQLESLVAFQESIYVILCFRCVDIASCFPNHTPHNCYIPYVSSWIVLNCVPPKDLGFPGGSEFTCNAETQVQSLGREELLEKGIATHSSVLAWRIPWTKEPGGLQSMGSQRVRHNWAIKTHKRYVEVLTLSICACNLIWKYGLCRYN